MKFYHWVLITCVLAFGLWAHIDLQKQCRVRGHSAAYCLVMAKHLWWAM
jgi:hypothetical protein